MKIEHLYCINTESLVPRRVLQSSPVAKDQASRLLAFVAISGCLQCAILEPFEKKENAVFSPSC